MKQRQPGPVGGGGGARLWAYLAIREQFCTMLLWMEMPWAASAFTMRPFWYQSTCMSWATKEAWHWKGRLSPWKTTCRWDGVSWKDGSSSGASGGEGGGTRAHTFHTETTHSCRSGSGRSLRNSGNT